MNYKIKNHIIKGLIVLFAMSCVTSDKFNGVIAVLTERTNLVQFEN
jgi:hypothetical protein